MNKRTETKINTNNAKIVKLLNENVDLIYNSTIKQSHRFSEQMRNLGSKKEPVMKLVKYRHWYEWFKDEDRPNEKGVRIERSAPIEIDGEKCINYFTVNDI